ncbi:MAG: hypothetical protein J3R72DRAFT_103643 [Linnemannia gamsii]|nr:MAG: hypothetical protein J3R72DRAFT_103643 [Linnemannia gamsii]
MSRSATFLTNWRMQWWIRNSCNNNCYYNYDNSNSNSNDSNSFCNIQLTTTTSIIIQSQVITLLMVPIQGLNPCCCFRTTMATSAGNGCHFNSAQDSTDSSVRRHPMGTPTLNTTYACDSAMSSASGIHLPVPTQTSSAVPPLPPLSDTPSWPPTIPSGSGSRSAESAPPTSPTSTRHIQALPVTAAAAALPTTFIISREKRQSARSMMQENYEYKEVFKKTSGYMPVSPADQRQLSTRTTIVEYIRWRGKVLEATGLSAGAALNKSCDEIDAMVAEYDMSQQKLKDFCKLAMSSNNSTVTNTVTDNDNDTNTNTDTGTNTDTETIGVNISEVACTGTNKA